MSRLGDHQLLVDDAAAQHRGSLVASRSSVYAAVGLSIIFFTGRMRRSGKLPVLILLTGQKQVFRPAGATRCTNSCQTLQGRRAAGFAWLYKISPQSAQGSGNAA